jgi:tRNA(Phe) wybutosine-synthesizing methylase Tyw3
MLKDYLQKIEKLDNERLVELARKYRDTIETLKQNRREAEIVAFNTVVNYSNSELKKKQEELEVLEKLLEERGLK